MREIQSAENPRLKSALKLRDSARERQKLGRAVLDGVHLVSAYMARHGAPGELFVTRDASERPEIAAVIERAAGEVFVLNERLAAKLSSVDTPTGIVAVIDIPRPAMSVQSRPCVFLEAVQDPGNVGSVLRSAAAAGVDEIFLSSGCADAWSPRVLRAGMGAHFALRIHEDVDIALFAKTYTGRIVAAAGDATVSVFDADLSGVVALLFGNEGAGLSAAARAAAHQTIAVPVSASVESLNVAAAAAVCLFERVHQMRPPGGTAGR